MSSYSRCSTLIFYCRTAILLMPYSIKFLLNGFITVLYSRAEYSRNKNHIEYTRMSMNVVIGSANSSCSTLIFYCWTAVLLIPYSTNFDWAVSLQFCIPELNTPETKIILNPHVCRWMLSSGVQILAVPLLFSIVGLLFWHRDNPRFTPIMAPFEELITTVTVYIILGQYSKLSSIKYPILSNDLVWIFPKGLY